MHFTISEAALKEDVQLEEHEDITAGLLSDYDHYYVTVSQIQPNLSCGFLAKNFKST